MFASGQYVTDGIMSKYVKFICSCISLNTGGSISSTKGIPMKGCFIPVKLEVLGNDTRTATLRINTIGFSKDVIIYMSRQKSPDKILHEIQSKIDDTIMEIIKENNLDQDKVFSEYHPLKQINKNANNNK